MAHDGYEFAFEPVRLFNFAVAALQFLVFRCKFCRVLLPHSAQMIFCLLALADVPNQGDNVEFTIHDVGTEADFHREQGAVFSLCLELQPAAHGSYLRMCRVVVAMTLVLRPHTVWDKLFDLESEQLLTAITKHF